MPDFRDLTVYVIRHGQTEDNVAGRWTGTNDSPLTEVGREHARASGRILKRLAGDLSQLDFLSSSLHRAAVTMEILREAAGLPPLGYRADRRLMENDCGDYSSMTPDEIRAVDAAHLASRDADEWRWAAPGGESPAAQSPRVLALLHSLTRDSVLVCHGLTSRILRMHLLGLAPDRAMLYEFHKRGVARFLRGEEQILEE
jgi:probable phosphoglycerate mutase